MNRHILVVDDTQEIRTLLQEVLEDEGYEVDMANDGLVALEKLNSPCASYDVLLLDLNMPRMDGLQLIQELSRRKYERMPLIIVLSADKDSISQATILGARHALLKPFDLETVLALVSASYEYATMNA